MCDVRYIYRDTSGLHHEWQVADQLDMMRIFHYTPIYWILCQNLRTGAWRYFNARKPKWTTPSDRFLAQMLHDYKSDVPSDRYFVYKYFSDRDTVDEAFKDWRPFTC